MSPDYKAVVQDRKIMDELKAEEARVVKVLKENEKLMTVRVHFYTLNKFIYLSFFFFF